MSRNKCLWVLMGNVLVTGIMTSMKATALEKQHVCVTQAQRFTAALLY